ncbi:unnamed protein product [Ceutorhynchus assimilis]|uniref:Uncharacterized protein n=1 Tax=Ceutorhynchus assimilis TaxID=467358 RepID=A0A9N9MTE9_9CUCU|nr:unnamed protein product [Ceutorhynchus assimilis]
MEMGKETICDFLRKIDCEEFVEIFESILVSSCEKLPNRFDTLSPSLMYDMIHHYNNYTNTLSRFLTGYHQLEEQNDDNENALSSLCEDTTPDEEPRCRSNSSATSKSFTIAAILGLNNNDNGNL